MKKTCLTEDRKYVALAGRTEEEKKELRESVDKFEKILYLDPVKGFTIVETKITSSVWWGKNAVLFPVPEWFVDSSEPKTKVFDASAFGYICNTGGVMSDQKQEEQFVGWLITELERRRDGCKRSVEAARSADIPHWIQSWCAKEEAYREVIDLINATKPSKRNV